MEPVFIAVVLVMIILIGFMAIVLHSLAVAAGIRIRTDMVKLLSSYDTVMEEKSKKIYQMQSELEELMRRKEEADVPVFRPVESSEPAVAQISIPESAEYRHGEFGRSYGLIKDHFMLNSRDEDMIISKAQTLAEGTWRSAAARRLYDELSFDTIFKMEQMNSEEQLRVLDTSLSDEDWTLLRDYCEESGMEDFSISRFCDWLEEISILESDAISVKTGKDEKKEGSNHIFEGIQIMVGNQLLDYSINEREIG